MNNIKIMSFNILYGTAPDHSWEHRKSMVLDRIRSFDPDLLGIQECRDDYQAEYIKSFLQEYEFFGVQRGGEDVPSIEMAPLLYKKSSFRELDRGCFWLSTTPTIPGSISWGGLPRTVTWVKLKQKDTPYKEFFFLNTHFDHESALAIHESVKLLRSWIDGLKSIPIILTGDFNISKEGKPYHDLLSGFNANSRPLSDTHASLINDGTLHGFGKLEQAISIDWTLVSSEFYTVLASVDHYHQGAQYPSDHYPLLSAVRFQ